MVVSFASILGSIALLLRSVDDWDYMTGPGRVALVVSLCAVGLAAALLCINRNVWFRVAGICALVVFAVVGYARVPELTWYWPVNIEMLLLRDLLGLFESYDLDPLPAAFTIASLLIGPVAYVAAARYVWLGLDHFAPRISSLAQGGESPDAQRVRTAG
jgi:hypothetical protein